MKQSGMPSRRHMPRTGPVRLGKSDGQFTVKNILTNALGSKVDKFTPTTCVAAESLEREHINYQNGNRDTCPSGYKFVGLGNPQVSLIQDPRFPNNPMRTAVYNNTCIKSDYDTTTWTGVMNCCNGVTPAKDCDPKLCKNSQGCRDKLMSTSWCNNRSSMGRPECVTYLNAPGNEDVKVNILTNNCTAGDLHGGVCRDFVTSGKAHGQIDSAVVSWCTDKIQKPITEEQYMIIEWAKFRYTPNVPMPSTRLYSQAVMDVKLAAAVAAVGGNPYKVIYPDPEYYNNSQDPICSCILSQLNKTGEKSPPVACFDSKCQLSGYQTTGMKNVAANCPSWVECRSTVLAASSGTVDNVKVNQMCGEPPAGTYTPPVPTSTPIMTTTIGGIKDDKTLLKEDEARATGTTPTPNIINMSGIQTLSQQLAAPFAPSLFGNTSVAEVSILFFVMLILGAIVYRSWMNRRATELIQGQYEAALEYDRQQELADRTREVKDSIAAMEAR